jgi:hypothetical protein
VGVILSSRAEIAIPTSAFNSAFRNIIGRVIIHCIHHQRRCLQNWFLFVHDVAAILLGRGLCNALNRTNHSTLDLTEPAVSQTVTLRYALFVCPQEDKDLVHEFVQNDGLACLIKVGSEADQNYQNYILRGEYPVPFFPIVPQS